MHACIRLKAVAARRTSRGPVCGTSADAVPMPMRSAAVASDRSGAVIERTKKIETRMMPSAIAVSEPSRL